MTETSPTGFIAKFEGGPAEGETIDVLAGDPEPHRWFCQVGDPTDGAVRSAFWAKWQPPAPDPGLIVTRYRLDRTLTDEESGRVTAFYRAA